MRKISVDGLKENVIAVPPVAWTPDQLLDAKENGKLVRHIESGGVTHLLYGGNANLYHFSIGQLEELLAILADTVADNTCVIPSVGPDFGKMMDQASVLRRAGYNSAMALPMAFPAQPQGVAEAIRRFTDSFGNGVILYVKRQDYLSPETLSALVEDGSVIFVKYAVERDDPSSDDYLKAIVNAVGAELIGSGMAEPPLRSHLLEFGLSTFTSGGVCIAPTVSSALRSAFAKTDLELADKLIQPFLQFERLRAKYNSTAVIHAAISLAGIAEMGPLLPMLCNAPDVILDEIRESVDALVDSEREMS